MRQVRTCDFCGGDATGIYEPLPASMPESPRMLLCDDCRDRLSTVVEPLLAEIEGRGDSPGGDDGRGRSTEGPFPGVSGGDWTVDRKVVTADPDDATEPVDPHDATEPADADDLAGGDPRADVGESRDAGGRTQPERSGAPRGYRKVLRFLENREFPIDRAEAERIAAEAYEFDEEAVAAAIDHAVRYGRLREVSGQLRR